MNPGGGAAAPAPVRQPGSRRNFELALLIFAMALVVTYAGIVQGNVTGGLTPGFWIPSAVLGVIFLVAHVAIRFLARDADPVLLPAVALINGLGVAFLRRIDLARVKTADRANYSVFVGDGFRQLGWTAMAVVLA